MGVLLGLSGALIVLASLPGLASGTLATRDFPEIGRTGDDFMAYLTGGALLAAGDAPHLYDPAAQARVQAALLASVGAGFDAPNTFVNPPLWGAAFVPFVGLGVPLGGALWRALSLVLAAAGLVAPLRRRHAALAALPLLGFVPFAQAWQLGSMVGVQVLVLGGWWGVARRGHPLLAGLSLSGLLLKPQYLPFPVLYLVWKRQWRQVGGLALGCLAQSLLTLLLFPLAGGLPATESLLGFVTLDAVQSREWVETVANHVSVRGAIRTLLPELGTGPELLLLAALTLLLWVGLLWRLGRRWPKADEERFAWEMLVVGVATPLTAIHNHISGMVFLLPAMALIMTEPRLAQRAVGTDPHRRVLALALLAPLVGIWFVASAFGVYVLSAWAVALVALTVALRGLAAASDASAALPRAETGA